MSDEINPGNSIAKVHECEQYMTQAMWPEFRVLYQSLQSFQDKRVRGQGNMFRDDDEFTQAWNQLRANTTGVLLNNIESAKTCEEYIDWMKILSKIVNDDQIFWSIIHSELQPSLKVTVEQSHAITKAFFTPNAVFEFGLESFLSSNLCDFAPNLTEDNLVDLFYAVAGFIRACELPPKYLIQNDSFIQFIRKIVDSFVSIPKF